MGDKELGYVVKRPHRSFGSIWLESLYHVRLESCLEELDDISEKLMVGLVVFMLVRCAPFEVDTSGLV